MGDAKFYAAHAGLNLRYMYPQGSKARSRVLFHPGLCYFALSAQGLRLAVAMDMDGASRIAHLQQPERKRWKRETAQPGAQALGT